MVTLEGILYAHDFPGPPNFESIHGGDERMRYWILRLPKPVCVNAQDEIDVRAENIREVQLVFENDVFYKKYHTLVRKRLRFRVVGSLFHQHTGHHVREILINVKSLIPVRTYH